MTLVSDVLKADIWEQVSHKTSDRVTMDIMNSIENSMFHDLDFITFDLALGLVQKVNQKMDIT